MAWTDPDSPAATYATSLVEPGAIGSPVCVPLKVGRLMAGRDGRRRVHFLPLHLAMEGYLAVQFGGSPVAWQEWTRAALSRGMSPRVESSYMGAVVDGLDAALRIFEIHPGQCGMVLYVAESLAAAFVTPHPDDYRALHPSLLQDPPTFPIMTYGMAGFSIASWQPPRALGIPRRLGLP